MRCEAGRCKIPKLVDVPKRVDVNMYQTTYSINSFFAMIGFNVMPLQFFIPIKFCHHVERKLTVKLAQLSDQNLMEVILAFLFDFVDKDIIQCKACITAVVVLQCHQCIAFTCNLVVFFM